MTSLRCTAKLLRRLGLARLPETGPSDAALGDWYATLFTLQRQPLVLCVSERSLLPVVLHARELRSLARHVLRGVGERLRQLDIPARDVERELALMQPLAFARTASRSVLGSMNDFLHLLRAHSAYEPGWQWTVDTLADELATVPCMPLGGHRPKDVARSLLQAERRR